jgi:hypothetical protein
MNLVASGRMEGLIALTISARWEAIARSPAGQSGKIKTKVDVQDGSENAPATLGGCSTAATTASSLSHRGVN